MAEKFPLKEEDKHFWILFSMWVHKFAKEFFKKVESSQGYVSWTEEAYADDAAYRSATRLGYIFLAFLLLGVLSLAAYAGYVHFGGR